MSFLLDPGDVSLVLQIVIFFLLVLGLPFVKGFGGKKNMLMHGYLTASALIAHTVLIFAVMIVSFSSGFGELGELSSLGSINVWSHVILGSVAEILGFVVVGFWISKLPSKMACQRLKVLMWPLLIIWAIALINGALIHILEIM